MGILQKVLENKLIFIESKDNVETTLALDGYKKACDCGRGAVFFSIARGKVSEGVDFRYVRQIHVLDPWFNMSRIEQVLGRGMRTCSHSLLPFKEQNCTVYLHTCRYSTSTQETVDEFMYRIFVEQKGHKIANKGNQRNEEECGASKPTQNRVRNK